MRFVCLSCFHLSPCSQCFFCPLTIAMGRHTFAHSFFGSLARTAKKCVGLSDVISDCGYPLNRIVFFVPNINPFRLPFAFRVPVLGCERSSASFARVRCILPPCSSSLTTIGLSTGSVRLRFVFICHTCGCVAAARATDFNSFEHMSGHYPHWP